MVTATIRGIRVASLCLFGYWVMLFAGTHLPRVHLPKMSGGNDDKILHLLAFAGLSFLLAWAIPTRIRDRFRNIRLAGGCAALYGALDELTQIPVGRTFDWYDLLADVIGISIGLACYTVSRELIWRIKSTPQPRVEAEKIPSESTVPKVRTLPLR